MAERWLRYSQSWFVGAVGIIELHWKTTPTGSDNALSTYTVINRWLENIYKIQQTISSSFQAPHKNFNKFVRSKYPYYRTLEQCKYEPISECVSNVPLTDCEMTEWHRDISLTIVSMDKYNAHFQWATLTNSVYSGSPIFVDSTWNAWITHRSLHFKKRKKILRSGLPLSVS